MRYGPMVRFTAPRRRQGPQAVGSLRLKTMQATNNKGRDDRNALNREFALADEDWCKSGRRIARYLAAGRALHAQGGHVRRKIPRY